MGQSRIWLILDGDTLARWQQRALDMLPAGSVTGILRCRNTRSGARKARHLPYYALNLVSIRNPLTRHAALSLADPQPTVVEDFDSIYQGAWQKLPPAILERIAADPPDCIVKFGMNLLRIPEDLPCPILSYHHGDPGEFRGRPAGFYEMLHGRRTMGQIVQRLSNQLDAGEIVAFAETRVMPHSYRATLVEAFRHSPYLLGTAIANAVAGRTLDRPRNGPNYRLPGPRAVARLTAAMGMRMTRRLVYGLLVEKKWEVSTVEVADGAKVVTGTAPLPARTSWTTLPRGPAHSFQADPFFVPGGIAVEALSRRTGKGEIAIVDDRGCAVASQEPGHHSYPGGIEEAGEYFMVPEIAGWSRPRAYSLIDGKMIERVLLDIEGEPRVLDPTLHRSGERLYLFGNIAERGSNLLYLWHAASLFGRFEAHPLNPIRISPRGARMAGAILEIGGEVIRLGQSFVGAYGDGIFAFRIDALSATDYRETPVGEIRLDGVRGPHTLAIQKTADGADRLLFDWYVDRLSPLAGLRRIRSRVG